MTMNIGVSSLSNDERKNLGYGDYGVEEIRHTMCKMKDGIQIALRLWAPSGTLNFKDAANITLMAGNKALSEEKFPAVIEYLPYRKSDWTSDRDHRRHPWLASHGYIVVRADIRGSGDSQGQYYDEYTAVEQDDGVFLIQWLAKQSWSNGKVGMYGKSWGGFNGLQIAFHQPPELAAVISLYSTDHRFEDDIHYKGGCLLGTGMLSWASTMFCWDARPPSPAYNPNWKDTWLERLQQAGESCAKKWIEHQQYDDYWKHGSIIEDVSKVKAAVLLVGGWHDGYTNAALRMSKVLPNCRTIIGPWSHNWPDEAVPGPNIGFLDECLSWWDQHLKGKQTKSMARDKIRWYQCEGSLRPGPSVTTWPGWWMAGDPDKVTNSMTLHLQTSGTLGSEEQTLDPSKEIPFSGSFGLSCGEWLSFGAPDLPADQRLTSEFGGKWSFNIEATEMNVFGRPKVALTFSATDQYMQIFCCLCHVLPSGASRLVSYGVLNLSSCEENGKLKLNKEYSVTVELDTIGYTIPVGDSVQLLISPGSWPTIWPSRSTASIIILKGSVDIPIIKSEISKKQPGEIFTRASPRIGPSNVQALSPAKFERTMEYGLSNNTRTIRTVTEDGRLYYEDVDTEIEDKSEDKYTIEGDDPFSVVSYCQRSAIVVYNAKSKNPIRTETHTKGWLKSDLDHFYLTQSLKTTLDGVDFYSKTWTDKIPRKMV